MPNKDVITPNQRKGMTYGALISAGLAAATGSDPRDAILKAAMGGLGAYAGGISSHYDLAQQELENKREEDKTALANMKMMVDQEKTAYTQEQEMAKELEFNQLIKNAMEGQGIDPNILGVIKMLGPEKGAPQLLKVLKPPTINETTLFQKAERYIPEYYPTQKGTAKIRNRTMLINALADKIRQNPNMAHIDLQKEANYLLNSYIDQKINPEEYRSKDLPPDLKKPESQKSSIFDKIVSKFSEKKEVQIPEGIPPGSQFKGHNSDGSQRWLTPDGKKLTYRP